MMDVKVDSGEEAIHYSQNYVNPYIDVLRKGLFAKMTCLWCLKFFTAERDPIILHVGRTRCLECAVVFYDSTPAVVKKSFPIDLTFAHSIRGAMKALRLFTSGTHVYSELERSLFKQNSYNCKPIEQFRCHFSRCAAFYSDVSKYYKKCRMQHWEFLDATYETINAVEICKEMRQLKSFSNYSKIRSSYLHLKSLQTSEILKQEKIEWVKWNRRHDTCIHALKSRNAYEYIKKMGVQWFGFFDKDGSRRYCELSSDEAEKTLCFSSFTMEAPKYSSLMALAEFFHIEPHSLIICDRVYFEICRQSLNGFCVETNRFYINLENPKSALGLLEVCRFLGDQADQQSCYLDAEIEVTENLFIFEKKILNGILTDEEDFLEEIPQDGCKYMSIKGGMVVSQIQGQPRKLTIFKQDSYARYATLFGYLNKDLMEALLTILIGRHRITACGVGINF